MKYIPSHSVGPVAQIGRMSQSALKSGTCASLERASGFYGNK